MAEDWSDIAVPKYQPTQAFAARMDTVFGKGKWRDTGDFRTQGREAQLRAQGADTARGMSAHSLGTPEAPGAHDIVVPGMPAIQVAKRLKDAGWRGQLIPEEGAGGQGAHLHVGAVEDWSDLAAPSAAEGGAAPAPKPAAPAKPVPPPSSDYMTNLRGRQHEDLEAMRAYQQANPTGSPGGALMHPGKTLSAIGGAADYAVAPVEAGVTAMANAESRGHGPGAAIDRAAGLSTNLSPQEARRAGDIAGLAVPVPGQAKIAGKGGEALRAVREGEQAFQAGAKEAATKAQGLYSKWLDTLKRYGFEPTPGMAKGREARMVEKTKEADSAAQKFYVKQADRAEESFQRAKFNYDLEPLGDTFKYRRTGPVGHKGVDEVYRTISGEFDKILPKVKLQKDAQLEQDLAKIEGQVEHLQGDETRRVFSAIDHDVRQQLGPRGSRPVIDGKAFKLIESAITKDAKQFRKSGMWRESDLLNDYLGALRSAMERSSSPEVAARLKQVNTAYARLSKTMSAAARTADSLGKFDTSDLLRTFKKDDVSGGSSFARGKMAGQGFAKRAHDVMHPGPRLPGEGEAVPFLSHHGIVTKAARALEKPIMTAAAKRTARLARERELLRQRGLQRPSNAGQIATGVAPQLAILSRPQQ